MQWIKHLAFREAAGMIMYFRKLILMTVKRRCGTNYLLGLSLRKQFVLRKQNSLCNLWVILNIVIFISYFIYFIRIPAFIWYDFYVNILTEIYAKTLQVRWCHFQEMYYSKCKVLFWSWLARSKLSYKVEYTGI